MLGWPRVAAALGWPGGGGRRHLDGRAKAGRGTWCARGGRVVPAGEGATWGRPAPAREGSGVVAGLCRLIPLGSGDGEGVMGERADPFCCSIRFDEENCRQG